MDTWSYASSIDFDKYNTKPVFRTLTMIGSNLLSPNGFKYLVTSLRLNTIETQDDYM